MYIGWAFNDIKDIHRVHSFIERISVSGSAETLGREGFLLPGGPVFPH